MWCDVERIQEMVFEYKCDLAIDLTRHEYGDEWFDMQKSYMNFIFALLI